MRCGCTVNFSIVVMDNFGTFEMIAMINLFEVCLNDVKYMCLSICMVLAVVEGVFWFKVAAKS
jgi:hypothetical protein